MYGKPLTITFIGIRMKTKSNNHGGRRPGAGNPGTPRVDERRQRITLTILPSILAPFRKKYGRGWARRVEELIERDENVATYPAKPRQTA